jgi:hypothetical protein
VPSQKDNQCAAQVDSQQGHRYRRNRPPDDERMPFPLPNLVKQSQRMMAQVLQLLSVHWQPARLKQVHPQINERNE